MKRSKIKTGVATFLFSIAALAATTWYLPFLVPGTYAMDKSAAWSRASNIFDQNQLEMMASGTMKQGDFVDAQYEDGTIVQFTLGAPADCLLRCTWTDDPFDTSKSPKILQGKWPGPRTPKPLPVKEGIAFSDPGLSPFVTSTTQLWSITIIQYGDGCDICNGTYLGATPSGSGSGGGGGPGGGSDLPPPGDGGVKCQNDCDGSDQN